MTRTASAHLPALPVGQPIDVAPSDRPAFSRAVSRWAVTGGMETKFATITTATAGGVLLPREISQPVTPSSTNAFRDVYTLYGVEPLETTTTADLTVPVLDANAGGVVAEDASADTDNPPAINESIHLPVKTYQSGTAWFSNQQLAATELDVLTGVVPQLVFSKELGLEAAIAGAIVADAGITQSVAAASTATLSYANLADLAQALPRRYGAQTAILLSRQAYAAALKLVGNDGHPVLLADPQNQTLVRFNGIPVVRCDYLQDFGVSHVIGLIVSLLGFRLRDVAVQNLARYATLPAKPNQTGLNLFAYHGYGWAPSAVAKLTCPAS